VANQLNAVGTGGRVRTNANQTLTSGVVATLNNGGSAAWTVVEDSGGFASSTGGTTTPLSVPAGAAGAYIIGIGYIQSPIASTRGYITLFINGTTANGNTRGVFTNDAICSYTIVARLNVGDTVGAQAYSSPASTVAVGTDIYLFRIGN
jgi:hypothetical protein